MNIRKENHILHSKRKLEPFSPLPQQRQGNDSGSHHMHCALWQKGQEWKQKKTSGVTNTKVANTQNMPTVLQWPVSPQSRRHTNQLQKENLYLRWHGVKWNWPLGAWNRISPLTLTTFPQSTYKLEETTLQGASNPQQQMWQGEENARLLEEFENDVIEQKKAFRGSGELHASHDVITNSRNVHRHNPKLPLKLLTGILTRSQASQFKRAGNKGHFATAIQRSTAHNRYGDCRRSAGRSKLEMSLPHVPPP